MVANRKSLVISAGIVAADVIVRPFTGMPEPGGLRLIEQTALYSGGCAGNTALTLARLGVPVEVVACVGADEFGDFVIRTLRAGGVGAAHVARSATLSTSTTVVLVSPDGERSFLHSIGANAGMQASYFPPDLLERAAILHLGGGLLMPGFDGGPAAAVLRAARAAGALTSLDTAFDRSGGWFRTLAPCFEHLDVLMANDQEAAGLSGSQDPERAARFFLEHGVRYAVVKLGEQGCLVMSASETHRLPAHSVSVVDTTGAGDAFAAGFLLGLLEGRSLRACAALGNAAGARCVSHIGAAAFPIAREDLAALL